MPHEVSAQQLAFAACLFGAVAMVGYVLVGLILKSDRDPLHERLRGGADSATMDARVRTAGVSPMVDRISKAVAKPLMPKDREEVSRVRRRFAHAGIYSTTAIHLFVLCKIILCGGAVALGILVGLVNRDPMIGAMVAAFGGLLGVVLPSMWLSMRIRRRQWALQSALPDALDLMVVCVEAGLTIDAAIQRVGHEIALAHPDISRELGITHMETRVGVARVDALRNLGIRTGCASIQSLSAMLVQAERFGTSIGTALRVHAESLRIKRQHAAEERAAKTTVKLAFPVVFFIFPTVIIVLGGPACILLVKSAWFSQ
ncbi:type II secretion system F family protein [soil metagenome]